MSIRFERFLKRIGKKSQFLPFKNRLLNSMKEDAKAKRKNYPRLIAKMTQKWESQGYKRENNIAHLLSDNVNEFFTNYLNVILPFRAKGLKYEGIKTPSRLDFIITVKYLFSMNEIKIITDILNDVDFPKSPTAEKICKFILLYSVNSFYMPIEDVFKRPFAFMPQKIDSEFVNGKKNILISVSVQGREQ